MRHSRRPLNNLDAIYKRTLLIRKYRNNLTRTPLISISYRMLRSTGAAIFSISKPDAMLLGRHALRKIRTIILRRLYF